MGGGFWQVYRESNYGATSFFEKNQINEEELEEIYKIDEEILERIDVMNITIKC